MSRLLCLLLLFPMAWCNLLVPFAGKLILRHVEFPNGIDEDHYYLADTTEHRLLFNQTPAFTNVLINGLGTVMPNRSIVVDSYFITESLYQDYEQEALLPQSNLRMIVFIINVCNASVSNTTDVFKKLIFKSENRNLADYYKSCSLNRVDVLEGDSAVLDPINIPCSANLNGDCSDGEYANWAYYAEAAAIARGVKLELYKHRVFIIPQRTSCYWLGLADVGCTPICRAWIKGAEDGLSVSALFHELGHNHGLRHASTPPNNEYGDYTAAMGGCCGIRCHNAAQAYSLGWYDPIPISNMTGTKFIEIPAMLLNLTNHIKIGTYFISFRGQQGYDSLLPTINQIHIHNYSGTPSDRYYKSYLIALLTPNLTWTEKRKGWSVQFISHSFDKALVLVTFPKNNTCGRCGDNICDPSAGENCLNCPKDCREKTTASGVYFCCGLTHTCHYFRCNVTRSLCDYRCGEAPPSKVKTIIL